MPYGTGLLDFNKSTTVYPSFILNASTGYTFATGSVVIRPQLYVENVFDRAYALKGPFFSGSSFGRPRSVQVRVNIGA
jgi:outer membrane receptor for Fe3+-dicitrate